MPFLKITAAFPSSQRRSRRLQQIEEDRVDGKMTELLQNRPRHVSFTEKEYEELEHNTGVSESDPRVLSVT